MTRWPPTAQDLRALSVFELRERAVRTVAELEDELAQARRFVDSLDQLSSIVSSAPDEPDHLPVAGTATPATGTVPERVLAALRAAGSAGMTARELTETIFGPGTSRSTLEGVRKAALRLVSRGQVSREDGKTFIAAEVGN